MQGSIKLPCALQNKNRKDMDKKFYEMPEVEVIDLELEGALLSDSNPELDTPLPGEGDGNDLG